MSNRMLKLAEKFSRKYGQTEPQMTQHLINAVGQPVIKSEYIKKVQQALLNKGQRMQAGADGIWGKQTFNALLMFQKQNNLPVDGKLNQQTVTALGLL
jgi:peptidoglycan hydrolase-like protein with peptidoglycan-binding domain